MLYFDTQPSKVNFMWITVQNMNKINQFFSAISQETHKIYEKYCHNNYSNFAQSQMPFYIYQQRFLITVPNMNKNNPFFSEISQQIHKMYEKLATITQIWQSAKCYVTSISNTSFLLVTLPDMKKITRFFSEIS